MAKAVGKPIYRRVVLKLSGEALQGEVDFGIDPNVLARLASEIAEVAALGVQIGVVIGGGNLFRGAALSKMGLVDRLTGDQMGMLATIMNCLAMRDALSRIDVPARMMSAIALSGVVDQYDRRKAIHHLEMGRVVLFAAGTGNPLVTTDSAASLRAIEVNADVLLKATNVDGIYSADPRKDKKAKLYSKLSFSECLDKELAVMDLTAFCQCRDHELPIRVFNINHENSLLDVVTNPKMGTTVK
jgi:uridylate kinase